MMYRFLGGCWLSLLLLLPRPAAAQSPQTRPLQQALARATTDTARVLLLADLAATYRYSRFDSVQWYAQQGLLLARRLGYAKGEGRCLSRLAILPGERGNLPQALRLDLQALRLNQASHDAEGTARTLNQTGLLYFALDDYRPALRYFFRALHRYQQAQVRDTSQLVSVITNLGASYEGLRQYDSAAFFLNQAWRFTAGSRSVHRSSWGNPAPYVLREIGRLQLAQGHREAALSFYRRSVRASLPENDQRSASRAYQYLAEFYHARQQTDSSIFYARRALALARPLPFVVGVVRNSALLSRAFETLGRPDSTLHYLRVMLVAQDSLYNPRRIKQLDAIGFAEQVRLQELETEGEQLRDQLRTGALLAGLGTLLLVALLLWRHNWQQRRAHHRLRGLHAQLGQQTRELTVQRDHLASTLQELRNTQSQLVLREKMASLGQLMAGVAHEIQHPVVRVRRFAALSEELCEELRQELRRLELPNQAQAPLEELLRHLGQHQASIGHHGLRAESIVRGMLEYSQEGSGPRQLTDLNVLAEEYLRLTYHDLRAKNRYFNAALLLRLDPAMVPINVVRQDIGRALVGVFSAALLAVQHRLADRDDEYVPQVELSTHCTPTYLQIRVRDNGPGLTPDALRTLFRRFPTDADAGLGLALSYDLITKGHGGTLTASAQPGQGTEYALTLPTSQAPSA